MSNNSTHNVALASSSSSDPAIDARLHENAGGLVPKIDADDSEVGPPQSSVWRTAIKDGFYSLKLQPERSSQKNRGFSALACLTSTSIPPIPRNLDPFGPSDQLDRYQHHDVFDYSDLTSI